MRKVDYIFGLQRSIPILVFMVCYKIIRDLICYKSVVPETWHMILIFAVLAVLMTLVFAFLHNRNNRKG